MSRKFQDAQVNFTAGELDPLLASREDFKGYYNGAEKMRNAIPLPQGGFRRRPGLRYLDYMRPQVSQIAAGTITATAPNGGTANNARDFDTATLLTTTAAIGTTNNYVVAHYDLGSAKEICFVDVYNFRLSAGSVNSEFVVQFSYDNISWNAFYPIGFYIPASTTAATRRFSINDGTTRTITARYWRFVRVGSTDLGAAVATISDMVLWQATTSESNIKLVPFKFSTTQKYLLAITDQNIAVFKEGVWQCDVANYTGFSHSIIPTMNWAQSLDALIMVEANTSTYILERKGAHTQWEISSFFNRIVRQPTYQWSNPDSTGNGTPAATSGATTFTSTTSYFAVGDVGKYIRGNDGFALITGYTSATQVNISVVEPYRFANTNPIGPGDWSLEENVWGSSHLFPASVTFHGGRLWFGGSGDRPQTLWGSKVGSIYDFGFGSGLADEAIDETIDTDDVNQILNIYSGRHLSIFCSSGEFYIPDVTNEPITPDNVQIKRTSSRGSKQGLRLIEITGAVLFIQRNGKALHEFLWAESEQSYTANNISLLASHLIKNTKSIASRQAVTTDESDFVLMVNDENDGGTLTILTTLRSQNVTAFSEHYTDGIFLQTAALDDEMYFAIRRSINGTNHVFLEKFDNDLLVDCAVDLTDRPSKQSYTATAGQTTFAYTNAITASSALRVMKKAAATGVWSVLTLTTDYTVTGVPGTGNVVLTSGAAAGDTIRISYPTKTFTGLTHLNGESATVIGDGWERAAVAVSGGSAVTTETGWETEAHAGLAWPDVKGAGNSECLWVKTMPLAPQLPEGSAQGMKRRIIRTISRVKDSKNLLVNGYNVPFDLEKNPPYPIDTPASYTGMKQKRGLLGWTLFGQVDITQDKHAPLTMLSMTKRAGI